MKGNNVRIHAGSFWRKQPMEFGEQKGSGSGRGILEYRLGQSG